MKNNLHIQIYVGPSSLIGSKFTIPEKDDYISATEFASKTEPSLLRLSDSNVDLGSDQLVIFSDEYFGITENFVNSLWRRLDNTQITKVILVNPPNQLIKQAERNGLSPKITQHEYTDIDEEKIRQIKSSLDAHLFGQGTAKTRIAKSLIPLLNKTRVKPIVLMLYGPPGVGKTESAKIIASKLDTGNLFRSQFSMMQTNSLADYLYGSKTSDRSLAQELVERETNTIVFDEFDKTNALFHSAFYQLFDEGIFEDKNYKIDLRRSIIICTSNYSSKDEVRTHLGNALFSRISSFIKFDKLADEDKKLIASSLLKNYYSQIPAAYRSLVPSQRDILKGYEAILLSCDNAREIDSCIQYVLSDLIYERIIG